MSNAIEPRMATGEERLGSDRNFGLVFAAVFGVIGFLPLIHGHGPHWIVVGVATVFGIAAVTRPQILRPLNFAWFRFGLLLHRVISPIVMGVVFFLCIMPMGLIMRLAGKDLLRLKRDAALSSYWIVRDPHGPNPETMNKQF